MAVTGIAGWHNIRGLRIDITLPDEIYAGVATLAKVRLINRKANSPSFIIRSTVLGNTVTTCLLNRGAWETDSFSHSFPERGIQTISWAEICSPFPVNFFVRRRRIPLNRKFPVFPAPLGNSGIIALESAMRRAGFPSHYRGETGELLRVADYTGNEPMKLIHWRLSAKHEKLKVKEMSSSSGEPVVIDIDSLPGRNLEERLSMACYLINRLIAANRPVGLKLNERTVAPSLSREHRLNLLAELAVYGKD